jgi:hypothetical protein
MKTAIMAPNVIVTVASTTMTVTKDSELSSRSRVAGSDTDCTSLPIML